MQLEQDRAALEGFRRGDHATLDALYRFYSPLVLRTLSRGFRVRAVGSQVMAAVHPLDLDAAHQETFVRAFSDAARLRYDGLKPFEPWLLAIARAAAVDVLRAQGKLHREAIALDESVAESLPAPEESSPEHVALRAEAAAVVQGFLAMLEADDLRFATARFIDGLSQAKAGALCGLSRQAARTREAKLKAACLAHLGQRGFGTLDASVRAIVVGLVLSMFFAR